MTREAPIWRVAFWILLALECAPFWMFRYLPSQDGPSHIHNAEVLANYGTEPIYQQYYVLTPITPAGNVLTQYILAALLKIVGPSIAEKLLLSGYAVLLFFGFRYFLRAFSPHADYFALFAGVLAPNWFLYMGFWNFCFSIVVLLFVLGYYARRERTGDWSARTLLVLGIGSLTVYMSHAVSWLLGAIAIAVIGAPRLIARRAKTERRQSADAACRSACATSGMTEALRRYTLPLASFLPPAALLLIEFGRPHEVSTCPTASTLRERLWPLYSFSFLYTLGDRDALIAKVLAGILLATFLGVVAMVALRRSYSWHGTSLLAISAIFGAICVAGPACVGSGSYIDTRVACYAWIFLVAWLASALEAWPRPVLSAIAAAFCGIAIWTFAARMPELSRWNQELTEVAAMGQSIRPESTVLAMRLERAQGIVDPLGHPVGLLNAGPIVDLGNYEADTDYFTSRFRANRSPFTALASLRELYSVPPIFDVERYEAQTRGRVDYLLFIGGRNGADEQELFRRQLRAFKLALSTESGEFRLYERDGSKAVAAGIGDSHLRSAPAP